MAKDTGAQDDLVKEALDAFAECEERDRENFKAGEDDIRFARLEEQWPAHIKIQRDRDNRPCLVINKLPTLIRQVVNDARQNKPQIKVQPQDSGSDPETAEMLSGLIRNIETSSDSDIAYDTAVDSAVTNGFGYFRVNLAYACDDNWDQDIVIEAVPDPFTIHGDPYSTAADSSDWNLAFATEMMPKKAFEAKFPDASEIDWAGRDDYASGWRHGKSIRVAEYWTREQIKRPIVLLSNGEVIDLAEFKANKDLFQAAGIEVVGSPRDVMSYKVTQRLLTGKEVLSTTEWAGKYIPIIPVYGDVVNLNGKRHLRSLIRSAKDAQMNFNFWRTVGAELVALAPKAPFIGKKGAFTTDQGKWETINSDSHAFIEFDGNEPPQRQPFAGVPAGALQEALNSSDDIKAIVGLYDASLGARSNETSGVAINARKTEGDVSTFHFIDNLSRGIRHGGRIVLDLIPKVYTPGRVVRILGLDGTPKPAQIGQGGQQTNPETGELVRLYDLSAGKYDLTVSAGPSYTTRREEAAQQMTELIRAYPPAAPIIGDLLAKNLDWPGADEIADRLKAMLPPQLQGQGADGKPPAPETVQAQQQAQQATQAAQQLQQQLAMMQQQIQSLEQDKSIAHQKANTDQFKAETERATAVHEMQQPATLPNSPAYAQR
jgi:hypothetical protein